MSAIDEVSVREQALATVLRDLASRVTYTAIFNTIKRTESEAASGPVK